MSRGGIVVCLAVLHQVLVVGNRRRRMRVEQVCSCRLLDSLRERFYCE